MNKLIVALALLTTTSAWAVGSWVVTDTQTIPLGGNGPAWHALKKITTTWIGDASTGSVPNLTLPPDATGYLSQVTLVPTAAKEAGTITTVADTAGSLNNKFFLISNGLDANKYYVWFNVNSAGTDPLVAGRTAVPVALSTNATANTVATTLNAALPSTFTKNSNANVVTWTSNAYGNATDIADGTAPTGFTLAVTTQGSGPTAAHTVSILDGDSIGAGNPAGVDITSGTAITSASTSLGQVFNTSNANATSALLVPGSVMKLTGNTQASATEKVILYISDIK